MSNEISKIRENIAKESADLKGLFETIESQEGPSTAEQKMQLSLITRNLHL